MSVRPVTPEAWSRAAMHYACWTFGFVVELMNLLPGLNEGGGGGVVVAFSN